MTDLIIHGAAGRMGQRLIALASADAAFVVVAAVEHGGHAALGRDAGEVAGVEPLGVVVGDEIPMSPRRGGVVIDFSSPASTPTVAERCAAAGLALLVGTTGLDAAGLQALDAAAERVAVLRAANMSLGVNLLFAVAAEVAAKLGPDYDIEIVEAHHRHKKDAPSGTALGLLEAICEGVGVKPGDVRRDGRSGDDPRPGLAEGGTKPVQIGMHSLRLGGEVGRHTAFFSSPDEQLELTHRATSRDVFARGALRTAAWLANRPAGQYTMRDVLGL